MRFVNLAMFFLCLNITTGIIVPEMDIFAPQLATYGQQDGLTDAQKWADFSGKNKWVTEAESQKAENETSGGVIGAVEDAVGYARLVLSSLVGFAKLLTSVVTGLGDAAVSAGLHPLYGNVLDVITLLIYLLARWEIKSARSM